MLVVSVLLALSLILPVAAIDGVRMASSLSEGASYWGIVETFSQVPIGTDAPSAFGDVTLISQPWTDSVVLDGWLYEMTIDDVAGTVVIYDPSDPLGRTDDWNISVEIVKPREDSAYAAYNISDSAGKQGLVVYLLNQDSAVLSGVHIVTGSWENETILLYDAVSTSWTQVYDDVRPAFPHDSEASGLRPDRYFLSFAHANNTDELTVTLVNSGMGVIFSQNVTAPAVGDLNSPELRFDLAVDTGKYVAYNVVSGWVIDNLMFRSLYSRLPVVEPVYEFVRASEPMWLQVKDVLGRPMIDAAVMIEGVAAPFNTLTGRYEANVPRAVDWDVPFNYTVLADGILIQDKLWVTTLMDPVYGVSIPRWWNGWDWVTVFGKDDSSSATSAVLTFADFDHPTTSYVSSSFSGSSTDILPTQSEIALHYPHDYSVWGHRLWNDAVVSSDIGHDILESSYTFASRWDDPGYVGVGDMYISLANPGNTASWQQVYAEYLRGTRMMGTSSKLYIGGNSSLLGSYCIYTEFSDWIPSWASWHPYQRTDLLDMYRAIDTGKDYAVQMPTARAIAENNGVLRLYNHGVVANESLLDWMVDPKIGFAYENWKATDGEVASYIYGRWSTEVSKSIQSTEGKWIYDVSRRDPISSGYWRVPVTVAIDIQDRRVEDVRVVSGEWDLNSSSGTLPFLLGGREMDIGYDIRGDTLYISYFWNSSAVIEVTLEQLYNPRIVSIPETEGLAYSEYSSNMTCTPPDSGPSVWSLETDAEWLSISWSDDTNCLVSGIPTQSGSYWANLSVRDGDTSSHLNWSITVVRTKTVSGHVTDESGDAIPGLLVMVTMRTAAEIRSVLYGATDGAGFYTVTFDEDEWYPDDTLIVSAYYDNRTESNSTSATVYPNQEVGLQFVPIIPEFGIFEIAVVAFSIGAIVVAITFYWRRKR